MASILEDLYNEVPDFPVGGTVEQQLEFLYEYLQELNGRLTAAAENAPVGFSSGSFTSADAPAKTITVVNGVITDIV